MYLVQIMLISGLGISAGLVVGAAMPFAASAALASLILVTELFREAQQIAAFSGGEFMTLYVEAAVVYWVICLFLSSGQSVLERRLDRYVAH